jgi:hypothetical protein
MRQLTINRTSWMDFRDVLAAREPFQTYGNLAGYDRYCGNTGRLPKAIAQEYFDRRESIDYVVMSYVTPIAWHDSEHGWIMPHVKYSVTTSKAQGRIAPGITALQNS